jgi:hypothetical protein
MDKKRHRRRRRRRRREEARREEARREARKLNKGHCQQNRRLEQCSLKYKRINREGNGKNS